MGRIVAAIIMLSVAFPVIIARVPSIKYFKEKTLGFHIKDKFVGGDSVADFTDVVKYGDRTEWRYMAKDTSAVIENRGKEWRKYSVCNDSLMMVHRETSREKRDFIINMESAYNDKSYLANTRRDMSFLYNDSGSVSFEVANCPVLILSEGDTIRDCIMEELEINYFRRGVAAEVADILLKSRVVEKESTWRDMNLFSPYAVSRITMEISSNNDTTITCESYCFPRELNSCIEVGYVSKNTNVGNDVKQIYRNRVRERSQYIYDKGQAGQSLLEEPKVMCDGANLSISAGGPYDFDVFDIAGRVLMTSRSCPQNFSIDLSSFASGEYVVKIIQNGEVSSHKIILR